MGISADNPLDVLTSAYRCTECGLPLEYPLPTLYKVPIAYWQRKEDKEPRIGSFRFWFCAKHDDWVWVNKAVRGIYKQLQPNDKANSNPS